MAIEYTFAFDPGQFDSHAIERLLIAELQLRRDQLAANGPLFRPGIACWVMSSSPVARAVLNEALTLDAPLRVLCRIGKFDEYEEGMRLLFDVGTTLLLAFPGDLVMLQNGEKVLLWRRQGEVAADCRHPYWKDRWTVTLGNASITYSSQDDLPTL